MTGSAHYRAYRLPIQLDSDGVRLSANLTVPTRASGLILFVHGSASGRSSPRNRVVARALEQHGFGTLLLDLLTLDEDSSEQQHGSPARDIRTLAARVDHAIVWLSLEESTSALPLGLFGVGSGASAAILAATANPTQVRAVVASGPPPGVREDALDALRAPFLLVVGGKDTHHVDLGRTAFSRGSHPKRIAIVPDSTSSFVQPAALARVATLASDWFLEHVRV